MVYKHKQAETTRPLVWIFLLVYFTSLFTPVAQAMRLKSGLPIAIKNPSEQIKSMYDSQPVSVTSEHPGQMDKLEDAAPLPLPPADKQSEAGSFTVSSTDGLVNKYTGDFSYSIPLADVEGLPLNLSYSSSLGMHSEASWVGLGWDLNVGDVTREMRGIPDEFNGEQTIRHTTKQEKERFDGGRAGAYFSIKKKNGFGILENAISDYSVNTSLLLGGYNNTYLGKGVTVDLGASLGFYFGFKTSDSDKQRTDKYTNIFQLNAGINFDSKQGAGRNLGVGLQKEMEVGKYLLNPGIEFSSNRNSRSGTTGMELAVEFDASFSTKSKKWLGAGLNSSLYLPYGSRTSIPTLPYNSTFRNIGLNWKQGFSLPKDIETGYMVSYYTGENKDEKTRVLEQKCLGYFHLGKPFSEDNGSILKDINRENQSELSEETPSLPLSVQTYDIFRVSSMTSVAIFRGRRQDVGIFGQPQYSSRSNGNSVAVGLVTGEKNKLSVSYSYSKNELITSTATIENGGLKFLGSPFSTDFDTTVYFKAVGEMTPENLTNFNMLNGKEVVYFRHTSTNKPSEAGVTNILTGSSSEIAVDTDKANQLNSTKPVVVAQEFTPYTAKEYAGIQPSYDYYPMNSFGANTIKQPVTRHQTTNKLAKGYSNHISSIRTVSLDGAISYFEIPVYALTNNSISFCATGLSQGVNGLTAYGVNDNTENNNRGITKLFDQVETPAYASTFLLTRMVSSDYIDRSNDGPSPDDIGSYHKINYSKLSDFKWRFPVGANSAFFNSATLASDLDDIANYSYGTREVTYLHSIESKNLVAEFTLSDRQDGCSVNIDGTLDCTNRLKKLDKIVIYNRSERFGPNGATAVPLQTIEFTYAYSLCLNTPTNSNSSGPTSGKLTLTAIRTYGANSREMGAYTYEFSYDAANNKPFSYANIDGWGGFKQEVAGIPNSQYPSVQQDATVANANANAWKLNFIRTPLGGTIQINYEADVYATVQNRKASKMIEIYKMTNMFDLKRMQSVANETSWSSLWTDNFTTTKDNNASSYGVSQDAYNELNKKYFTSSTNSPKTKKMFGKIEKDFVPNNVIIFPLDQNIPIASMTKSQADLYVKSTYFTDHTANQSKLTEELFFRANILFKENFSEVEQVPFFAKIMTEDLATNYFDLDPSLMDDNYTVMGVLPAINGSYSYGYVILEPAPLEENEDRGADEGSGQKQSSAMQAHPIQLAALEYMRKNLPDLVYGTCPECCPKPALDLAVLFGADIDKKMLKMKYAPKITSRSAVRLYVPETGKFGGNGRVKSITYSDEWGSQTTSQEASGTYTWKYSYADARSNASFGNASFEPDALLFENSLYEWEKYANVRKHFPDVNNFRPKPAGLLLMPGANVGYSSVAVSFDSAIERGKSISSYYTTLDKPVKITVGERQREIAKSLITQEIGLSQGYYAETNDFAGKSKETKLISLDLNGNEKLISRTTYNYSANNRVQTIDRQGNVTSETIACETDMHADAIQSNITSFSFMVGVQLKWLPPPLWVMPLIGLPLSSETTILATTFVKHANVSAVLTSVTTEYLGSVNVAENLVYDRFTGNVLLTSLLDEYNDPLYSVNYPSHWYYEELRQRHNKEKKLYTITFDATGSFAPTNSDVFSVGDIVKVDNSSTNYWLFKKEPVMEDSPYFLVDNNGFIYSPTLGNHSVYIVSTGRNNRLNETMQSVVTKRNPLSFSAGNYSFTFPSTEIINASALTYRNKNNYSCKNTKVSTNDWEILSNAPFNPFKYGGRGDLVVDESFSWQEERLQGQHAFKTRFDGTYASYVPFYSLVSGKWKKITPLQKWRSAGKITLYNQFGSPIQSTDPLGIHSSVLNGYSQQLQLVPTAQAANALKQQIAFDGFEDYGVYENSAYDFVQSNRHFDFKNSLNTSVVLDATVRHSGVYSLRVAAGSSAVNQLTIDPSSCENPVFSDGYVDKIQIKLDCECIPPFAPTPGDYLISCWVRNNAGIGTANGTVSFVINGVTSTFVASGPIIDGWQRLEAPFTIPVGVNTITLSLASNSSLPAYFDDLRIHPSLAAMTTTVYDPKTLLPMATHDAYNFTTFYNYDNNLNQVKVRVETTEGVKTVVESESGGFKRQIPSGNVVNQQPTNQ